MIMLAASVAVLAVLALAFGRSAAPGRIDTHAQTLVDQWFGSSGPLLRFFVHMADAQIVIAFALSIGILCLLARRIRLAALAVCGPGLTGVATSALQPLIGRRFEGGFALPSGHAGGMTAMVTVMAVIGVAVAGGRLRRTAAVAAGGIVVLSVTMSVALVANDEHYWTDTVAGSCTALTVVLGLALVLNRARPRPASTATDRPVGG